ncbi:MAG: outer membrane beta-barrel protein [Candidatus Obscuribacterales bacterium]|nr:outer membrane beta-barrel protein [Candidatus Obscuribacterales bacterium]
MRTLGAKLLLWSVAVTAISTQPAKSENVTAAPSESDELNHVLISLHGYQKAATQNALSTNLINPILSKPLPTHISNQVTTNDDSRLLLAGGSDPSDTGGGRVNNPPTEHQIPVELGAPPVAVPPDLNLRDPLTNAPEKVVDPNNIPAAKGPPPAATPFAPEGELRRALPAPLDPVFPSTEFVGQPVIGVPDTGRTYALEEAIYKKCPALKKARIQIYGWANPGWGYNTSHHSAIPLSYAIVPRHLEMEQTVLRIERTLDTVQTEHIDWGFRVSNVYGTDYRYTTAQSWYPASNELLKSNSLYGYDPVECYGQLYFPKILKGMVLRVGRYISPPDIEAQLAPDNYLWTHSVMFTYDAYTHTGAQASFKLSDRLMYQIGLHAGSDMAAWAPTAIPTLESFLRYTTKNNKDSFYGGVDGINNGRFRGAREVLATENIAKAMSAISGTTIAPGQPLAHDNIQQFNLTWGHKFNDRLHTMTEGYLLYSIDALQGGTVNYGAPRSYNASTGPGAYLHGTSYAAGFVNYTALKLTPKTYLCIRPIDYLLDPRGWRTGFATTYGSWTIGLIHRFNDYLTIRPEIRYESALTSVNGVKVTPYDNGTKRSQFTIGMDLIQRF